MSKKFFYLYLIGGFMAVGLLIYDIVRSYPNMIKTSDILLDVVPAILLFYLSYKSYHEKKDQELM